MNFSKNIHLGETILKFMSNLCNSVNPLPKPEPSTQEEAPIVYYFSISVGKNPDENEDANPVCLIQVNRGLIGVFDGMGGAGSTIYRNKEGQSHTGAYFASHIVKELIERHFKEFPSRWENLSNTDFLDELKQYLAQHLRKKLLEFEKNPSRIRSSLTKQLPTTLASIYFIWNSECKMDVVWAGDSRAYLLDSDGLHQVSIDDVKATSNDFSDMGQDVPLSNCVSADNDFELRHRTITIPLPLILFVATDGCFGYVRTPAHFEYIIINTLFESKNFQEWGEKIEKELKLIAGDDFSMSLVCLGWENFTSVKEYFQSRMIEIKKIIMPVDAIIVEIQRVNSIIKHHKVQEGILDIQKKNVLDQFWDSYKLTYKKFLSGDQ